MISLVPGDGSLESGRWVFDRLRLLPRAESLGGVENLVCHPASMPSVSVPRQDRLRIGVADGFIRLSAGSEDVQGPVADLEQAPQDLWVQ